MNCETQPHHLRKMFDKLCLPEHLLPTVILGYESISKADSRLHTFELF